VKAKDTVIGAGKLCIKVCEEHRSATLEAKDCTSLDCEECQLEAQAEISFKAGIREVIEKTVYLPLPHGYVSIKANLLLHPKGRAMLKEWGIE